MLDCTFRIINPPTLQVFSFQCFLAASWVPKDIVSSILTVQEEAKPHGWGMFSSITVAKLWKIDDINKLYLFIVCFA